jgi:type I restriction enzyme S subunit
MRSEWREVKLKDVLLEKGYIRGPFGSALRRGELLNSGPIPVYEQMHAIDGIRDFRYYIDDAKYESLKRFTVRSGDLIVSCSGTVGCISTIKPDDPIGIVSQALLILRADPRIILPEYLRYYLTSPEGQHAIISRSSGSVQVNIARKAVIIAIDFLLPPLEIQKAIVDTMSCLDAKIELNNKINENLEAQAQAVFKSWFVDFEPFQNGEFVDSELGLIPEGWHVAALPEYIDVTYGAAYQSKYFNESGEGMPLIRIRDLKTRSPQVYTTQILPNQTVVEPGDLIAGMDAEFAPYIWTGQAALMNQRVCMFRYGHSIVNNLYTYFLIKPHLEYIQFYKTGTTVSHLGKRDIDAIKILVPPRSAILEYCGLVEHQLLLMIAGQKQNMVLSILRNTLLPKLMSGEIEVPVD